ncbi:hypothetical protein AS026_19435 [Rhizobium altiplani]|uniref:Succinoglycan biosynthesis protein exoi n=1 Tax=Rhizobium altiplani TaxID=1864509 RepID=A0A109J7P3_9HYPH|nr:hypothetical protein [Rhizobium altiplani]KWV43845.1 hypothetical protein AS026_19435 [Rhizobium altiplani]
MKFPAVVALSSAAAFLGAGGYTVLPTAVTNAFNPACNIKGNISINSGERIFHVPGQHYYADTVIRYEYGERWFCSEQEARAAGWRKAGY